MSMLSRRDALALALIGMAFSAPALAAGLEVEQPWARPTNAANGAAYMTITNPGDTADRLVSAASDVAGKVELHTHTIDSEGVARMRPVEAIDVPAKGSASLAPGGLHVMLIGLHGPLTEGQPFPLTLSFEKAGRMTIEVAVEKKAAMPAMPAHGAHGGAQGGGHGTN